MLEQIDKSQLAGCVISDRNVVNEIDTQIIYI